MPRLLWSKFSLLDSAYQFLTRPITGGWLYRRKTNLFPKHILYNFPDVKTARFWLGLKQMRNQSWRTNNHFCQGADFFENRLAYHSKLPRTPAVYMMNAVFHHYSWWSVRLGWNLALNHLKASKNCFPVVEGLEHKNYRGKVTGVFYN